MTTGPTNVVRERAGFLSVESTAALAAKGVAVLDPYSTLVSAGVSLAAGVMLWPSVILDARDGGLIFIGEAVQLYPGTRIVATGGKVTIGRNAEIGEEGGFTIKAERPGQMIEIGEGARLLGGGSLTLGNRIGSGAQVLGPIRMQNCVLGDGGTYAEPDPDRRGAVLKGSGVARDIRLPAGKVIQAFGLFSDAPVRDQSYFHPEAVRLSRSES